LKRNRYQRAIVSNARANCSLTQFNCSYNPQSMNIIHLLIFSILLLVGCSGSDSPSKNPVQQPLSQGTRVLGIDVKEIPSVTYDSAYQQAMALGVREVSVALDWALLEPTLGNYDNALADIIESYYPIQTGDLTLVLRPLDTPGPSFPSDLAGNFDDPAVILAYENFLTNLHSRLANLNASGKLKWIHVGNEIDANLGTDAVKWAQWQTFFVAIKAKIKSLWGAQIEVSSIVQFNVLNDVAKRALYLNLLADLDNAVLTYYPLNADFTMRPPTTVAADFEIMVNTITAKDILLQECGYPTSALNNSSESLQADFISSVFKAWDNYSDRIKLIDIAWQYDVSETEVDQWVIDFGMSGQPNEDKFKQYLWTLGLGNYDSTEKLALQRLRDELQARSWVNN